MSKVVPFDFDGHPIRVVTDASGAPWFSANEVCEVLGFANPRDAVARHVDADDVGKHDTIDSLGRSQSVNHVNESGMYALIFGSTKSEAKHFKKWVTSEVLPSIRKTGSYVAKGPLTPLKATAEAAKAFAPLVRVARLLGCDKNAAAISANQAIYLMTNINLMQQLGQGQLEAEQQDSQWYTPTELGKLIGTSARGVNLLLAESGLQMKMGEKWEATDAGRDFCRLFDTSKKHHSGVPVTQMKWSRNVLPMLGEQKEAA